MANYSRWDDLKKQRPEPTNDTRAGAEQDVALGQLIYDRRSGEAKLSQRELTARMGTTQSVTSRLEEVGGARNRLDPLARVATALDRHLIVSFPEVVPKHLKDAVQVAWTAPRIPVQHDQHAPRTRSRVAAIGAQHLHSAEHPQSARRTRRLT